MTKPEQKATIRYVRSKNPLGQRHRWVLIASNGKATAGPQENYTSKVHALTQALRTVGFELHGATTHTPGRPFVGLGGNPYYRFFVEGWTYDEFTAALAAL